MIREAIGNFKMSPTLTDNIMQDVSRIKPTTPSASKPLIPWMMGAAGAVLIALMFGIGSQYLAQFQKPFSLDAQSERTVEFVDAPIVQNLQIESDNRNQTGMRSDLGGSSDGDGENADQALGDQSDYTRWNLPLGAKRRLGKGVLSDMKLSPDGTRLAIVSSTGVWLYDVSSGQETPLLTKNLDFTKLVSFSPDGKILVSAADDNTISIWDVDSGRFLRNFKTPHKTYSTGFKFGYAAMFENLLQDNPPGNFLFSLEFLADGKTLVGITWDRTVWFWDITTGKKLNTFHPKFSDIKINGRRQERELAAFVDQTGKVSYAIGNKDGSISIQDGNTNHQLTQLIARLDNTGIRKDDGTLFPIQYQLGPPNRPLSILERIPKSWKEEASTHLMRWISHLEYSPNGKILLSKCDYRFIRKGGSSGIEIATELWDVDTKEQLAALPWNINVKFSNDNKTVALIGPHGCSVWDIVERSKIAEFPAENAPDVRFSEDGNFLAIIGKEGYKIWDVQTRREILTLSPIDGIFENLPDRIVLSEDGNLLVLANKNGVVNVWNTRNSKQLRALTKNFVKPVRALTFSHDGKTLASSDRGGNIQLWDPIGGKKRETIRAENKGIDGLAFWTDSTTLTSVHYDSLKQWDITTGKQLAAHTILLSRSGGSGRSFGKGTGFGIDALAFTPDSKRLIVRGITSEGTYKVWDIKTCSPPHLLSEIVYQPGIVAISPDGNIIASSNDKDTTVYLWNSNTGNQLATFNVSEPNNWIGKLSRKFKGDNSVLSIAFTPNGKTLAIGNKHKEVELWDVVSQQRIKILKGHRHAVCKLAFSSDGTIIASGDVKGKIILRKFPNCQLITTFNLPSGSVDELVFAPDGKILASVGSSGWGYKQDGTILLWDVPSK